MITITVLVDIEEKEEPLEEMIMPWPPSHADLISRLTDVLGDVTKHDNLLGWRVLRVR
ncbi:MAG TPA: hypothetical protein VNS88_05045 [Nitrospiraceae bacterium]|nr:hypothetical protein [Nitrospiraceae bacterium]